MTENERDRIVLSILKHMPEAEFDLPKLVSAVIAEIPGVTDRDVVACFGDAVDILRDDAATFEAETEALESLAPLFDGLPEGTPLGECARIKAEQGDPLAIAFLQWEVQQAGGVQ